MTFTLSETQVEKLNAWRDKVTDLHGEIDMEQFIFTPTSIGVVCVVKNITHHVELNLTEIENW